MDAFFSPFNFIIVLALIGMVGGVAKAFIDSRSRTIEAGANEDYKDYEHQLAEHERRFTEMEERIQVLERIATDSKSQLKQKIDAL